MHKNIEPTIAKMPDKKLIAWFGIIGGISLIVALLYPQFGLLTLTSLTVISLAYRYPRAGVWAMLIYMPFAGTVTYGIGGGNMLWRWMVDFFYIPAAIALFLRNFQQGKSLPHPKVLMLPLGLLLATCLLTLLSVNGWQQFVEPLAENEQPLMMGLMGGKALLGYCPLMVCAYWLMRDRRDFLFLTRLLLILAIVCCTLSFIQYGMLRAGVCQNTNELAGEDLFRASLDARCFVGGALFYSPQHNAIDLPGTFLNPITWAWFLISTAFFSFASTLSEPSKLWRIIGIGTIICIFIATLLSGQGVALILVPTAWIILLAVTLSTAKRAIAVGAVIALMFAIALAIAPDFFQARVESLIGRWQYAPPPQWLYEQFNWIVQENIGLLGQGLGRATNSARIFGATRLIESYHGKLLYEIGPLGILAFLSWIFALLYLTFKSWYSLRDERWRSYGICFWIFLVVITVFPFYNPLGITPINILYWFFVGLLLKLPKLEGEI